MDKYIEENKAAWEEAFENRNAFWGTDITERVRTEDYPFFNEETKSVLKKLHTEGSMIGQFCCRKNAKSRHSSKFCKTEYHSATYRLEKVSDETLQMIFRRSDGSGRRQACGID